MGTRLLARCALLIAAACISAAGLPVTAHARGEAAAVREIPATALPREAQHTLQLIRRGGPFEFERDGVVFGNYERLLPPRNRGYYREYTVPTPGVRSRGARRIIGGNEGEYYYTDDHYRSFKRIRE